jgi:ribosome maturation factor RimP
MQKIREKIRQIFSPILEKHDIDFVDLEVHGSQKNFVIKAFVDEPGGITIEKCARLNSEMRDALDIADVISDRNYRLEVSSPGLDRPLITSRDFFRNIGRHVEICYSIDDNQEKKLSGKIAKVDDKGISFELDLGKQVTILPANIKRAVLQIKLS